MYSLDDFGKMMRDTVRMGSHIEALRRAITPTSTLLEIGTGTGVFAFIACQLGARHVYAVETNPLIEFGKQMAVDNHFADRITFIQGDTTAITLPEQVDIVFGDCRGQLPLLDRLPTTFADAKKRHLKPGGILMPQRDTLYITVLQAPDLYNTEVLTPWAINPYGLDMSAALDTITNESISKYAVAKTRPLTMEHVLLPPKMLDTLEYGERTNLRFGGTNRWVVEAPGTAHFIHVWFDTELYDGVGFSNAPGSSTYTTVYGTQTFPLKKPLTLQPGNVVEVRFQAVPIGRGYLLRWHTKLFENEAAKKPIQVFDQSPWFTNEFFAQPVRNMPKFASSYVPKLSPDGYAEAFILDAMASGTQTVEQIARQTHTRFPEIFANYEQALEKVADLSYQFS